VSDSHNRPLLTANAEITRELLRRMEAAVVRFRAQPQYEDYRFFDLPTESQLGELLSVAFWAGLEREEGRDVRFSLAFTSRGSSGGHYPLQSPVALTRENVRKLAPAYERGTSHMGVSAGDGRLQIWGAVQYPGDGVPILDALEPRLIAVRFTPETLAMTTGDTTVFLPEGHVHRAPQEFLNILLGGLPFAGQRDAFGTALLLSELAPMIRKHGHGGLVVVVKSLDAVRADTIEPGYHVDPGFDQQHDIDALDARVGFGRLAHYVESSHQHVLDWRDRYIRVASELGRLRESAQKGFARLALVDGALVVTSDRRLVGFGARLVRPAAPDSDVAFEEWDPVTDRLVQPMSVNHLRGTRHRSAANFVADNASALALVVSQDGRVAAFLKREPKRVRYYPHLEYLFL